MTFTTITGKKICLRCSEIEYFYPKEPGSVIMSSQGKMYRVLEDSTTIHDFFIKERAQRFDIRDS